MNDIKRGLPRAVSGDRCSWSDRRVRLWIFARQVPSCEARGGASDVPTRGLTQKRNRLSAMKDNGGGKGIFHLQQKGFFKKRGCPTRVKVLPPPDYIHWFKKPRPRSVAGF